MIVVLYSDFHNEKLGEYSAEVVPREGEILRFAHDHLHGREWKINAPFERWKVTGVIWDISGHEDGKYKMSNSWRERVTLHLEPVAWQREEIPGDTKFWVDSGK